MMKYIWFISLIVVLGCKKSEDRNCWKSVGSEVTLEIAVDPFDQLYMGPHLSYELIQGDEEKVVIVGGKNLVNFIETNVTEKKLIIRNNNKCNFLRSYDKVVHVQIYLKDVKNIEFEGTQPVSCPNAMNLSNLTLVLRDGAGLFNLTLNAPSLHVYVTHGWGNFNIAGNVGYLYVELSGNGFGSVYNLNVSDSLNLVSNSTELLKVNPDNCQLRAQSFSSGDIWYIGSPTFIEYNAYSTGELIDKN